tara:strand:+ start:801 stop:1871 length:1071 start_codon:yes stop_codon:yes gene_type:complete
MATWKKVVLSGSAASLSSLTLTTALAATQGGTGFDSYTAGDILYASSTTALAKLGVGSQGQVLGISSGLVPQWQADQQGSISNVTSGTTSQLTVASTPNAATRQLSIVTAAVADNETGLATGDQIEAFASANFSNNVGTVTSVSGTGTVRGLSLSGTVTSTGNITLGGNLTGILNSELANSAVTIGSTSTALGATSTALNGLTGLDFTAADASIATSLGANTLTIGGATSTVRIPGNFRVAGTASFTDAETLEISDKVILLSSGSVSANAGGFIVQQSNSGGQFFGYDNATSGGRFGFQSGLADNTTPTITQYVATVQIDTSAPSGNPTYGGTSGAGNVAIDTAGDSGRGEMYIYI